MLSTGIKLEDVIMILSRDALFSQKSTLSSSEKSCRSAILAGFGGEDFIRFSSKTSKKLLADIRAGRLFLR